MICANLNKVLINFNQILCKHVVWTSVLVRSKSYYITTPIYYVNSVPHIGHLYTTVLADTSCRWQKLKLGHDQYSGSKLVTGTDEHGLKVKKAAVAKEMETIEFCNAVSARFKNMAEEFGVDVFDFVRTTEARHYDAVQHFWQTVERNGFIYKGVYKGWYSIPDEAFVSEARIATETDKITGEIYRISKESGHRLEWMEEENYMFKLSEFQEPIRDWVLSNKSSIHPVKFRNILLQDLDQTLEDLSISRHESKVSWGIPVPGDDTHRVYVWFDALVNYLTSAGYPDMKGNRFKDMWPADVHVVGQDILRFHAVYWPAFLLAAGLELPRQIVVHSHWLYDNSKMSKSKGNVVDPFEMAKSVTPEGLRYFLLRQGVIGEDCNFSEWLLCTGLNTDLANDLGNCLHRIMSKKMAPRKVYPNPALKADSKDSSITEQYSIGKDIESLIKSVKNLPHYIQKDFDNFMFYRAIAQIIHVVQGVNIVLTVYKLFKLDRSDPQQLAFIDTVLYCCCEAIRVCCILLQPIIPKLAEESLNKLGVSHGSRQWENALNSFPALNGKKDENAGRPFGTNKKPLFLRLNVPERPAAQQDKSVAS